MSTKKIPDNCVFNEETKELLRYAFTPVKTRETSPSDPTGTGKYDDFGPPAWLLTDLFIKDLERAVNIALSDITEPVVTRTEKKSAFEKVNTSAGKLLKELQSLNPKMRESLESSLLEVTESARLVNHLKRLDGELRYTLQKLGPTLVQDNRGRPSTDAGLLVRNIATTMLSYRQFSRDDIGLKVTKDNLQCVIEAVFKSMSFPIKAEAAIDQCWPEIRELITSQVNHCADPGDPTE